MRDYSQTREGRRLLVSFAKDKEFFEKTGNEYMEYVQYGERAFLELEYRSHRYKVRCRWVVRRAKRRGIMLGWASIELKLIQVRRWFRERVLINMHKQIKRLFSWV